MQAKQDTLNRLSIASEETVLVLCPTCDAKLTKNEVARHCEEEIERLQQIQSKIVATAETIMPQNGPVDSNEQPRRPCRSVFQRVQRNRQTRLKQRLRKRAAPTDLPCPMCNVTYAPDEIQRHAERCIRLNSNTNGRDDHSSTDEENGDEYEEYEWAGQKRIRASSLLLGGYAAIGIGQTIINNRGQQDDEDEDLNVDEDDTHIYGPTQYVESDVIAPTVQHIGPGDESDVTNYMRRLITSNSTNAPTTTLVEAGEKSDTATQSNASNNVIPKIEQSLDMPQGSKTATAQHTQHYLQIIEALKVKLRHYENQMQSKLKCLICLDDYRNPAISVSCWHVHCEECWLRSLGLRKLCPQCNLITTPKDLRRIYM